MEAILLGVAAIIVVAFCLYLLFVPINSGAAAKKAPEPENVKFNNQEVIDIPYRTNSVRRVVRPSVPPPPPPPRKKVYNDIKN